MNAEELGKLLDQAEPKPSVFQGPSTLFTLDKATEIAAQLNEEAKTDPEPWSYIVNHIYETMSATISIFDEDGLFLGYF